MQRFEPTDLWPEDHRAAAWFSFDIDGESWLLGVDENNANLPATMSQAAYGPQVGTFEILRLLARWETTATFFIPSWIAERYPQTVEAVLEGGHEVGLHGHVHEPPQFLTRERELEIVGHSIEVIEEATGRRPTGYRAPGAESSVNTVDVLREHRVRYSSQFMADYIPYFHGEGDDAVLELPFHWNCDDWPYTMLSPYALPVPHVNPIASNTHIIDVWSAEFDARRELGGLFVLCNHPQITGRPGRLATLESMLQRAAEATDVWVATGDEIDRHWRATDPTVHYVTPAVG